MACLNSARTHQQFDLIKSMQDPDAAHAINFFPQWLVMMIESAGKFDNTLSA